MKYDLAIIGAGSAGYSAAIKAATLGMKAVIIERELLGGTCVNRGCVPTKFLAHTADLYKQIRTSEKYGITVVDALIDYAVVQERKYEVVDRLRTSLETLLKKKKIEIVKGNAFITNTKIIKVDEATIDANNILICTGSKTAPAVIGGAITSDDALNLKYIPETLNIIGGGIIAVEFAHIFNALGSKVTMCLRSERILRRWDKEISQSLTLSFKKRGIDILPNLTTDAMTEIPSSITISVTGRVPDFTGLFDKELGIEVTDGIIADEYGRTSVSSIYAAGDVTNGSVRLASVAMLQGERAVEHISGTEVGDFPAVVKWIGTSPEVATVGFTEVEGKMNGLNVVTGKYPMGANARTMISTDERGFVKLVVNAENQRIIGAQMMCERAGDISNELALAINSNLVISDVAKSLRTHPSFAEGFTEAAKNLMEKMK
jgi:dihydrolipoamide dehydrogenase